MSVEINNKIKVVFDNNLEFSIFLIGIVSVVIFMLIAGYILGGRSKSNSKNIPFESGIDSIGDARLRFSIKFYLIAMFFVIFDVEALYIYAWSIVIREAGWGGFIEAVIFIFILLISLIYLERLGYLNFTKKFKNLDKQQ